MIKSNYIINNIFKLIIFFAFTGFSSVQASKWLVGFPQDDMSNPWRKAQVEEVAAALKAHQDIEFIYTDARGNPTRQAIDAENMLNKNMDALLISPRDSHAMTPVISRIYETGIPVILLTRQTTNDKYTSFISASDYDIAYQSAEEMAKRLNFSGKVVMIQGIETATTSIDRTKGFIDGLKQYKNITIVAKPYANYDRFQAIKEMEKIIHSKISFDAIYCHNDGMAIGVRMAMEMSGLDPADYIISGIDYIQEAREAIKKGKQSFSFTYPTAGRQAVEILLKIKTNPDYKPEKTVNIPFTLIDRENVDDIDPLLQ